MDTEGNMLVYIEANELQSDMAGHLIWFYFYL